MATQRQNDDASSKKKPYIAPQLTEYGSVAKLTEGSTGTTSDGKRKQSSGKKKG